MANKNSDKILWVSPEMKWSYIPVQNQPQRGYGTNDHGIHQIGPWTVHFPGQICLKRSGGLPPIHLSEIHMLMWNVNTQGYPPASGYDGHGNRSPNHYTWKLPCWQDKIVRLQNHIQKPSSFLSTSVHAGAVELCGRPVTWPRDGPKQWEYPWISHKDTQLLQLLQSQLHCF